MHTEFIHRTSLPNFSSAQSTSQLVARGKPHRDGAHWCIHCPLVLQRLLQKSARLPFRVWRRKIPSVKQRTARRQSPAPPYPKLLGPCSQRGLCAKGIFFCPGCRPPGRAPNIGQGGMGGGQKHCANETMVFFNAKHGPWFNSNGDGPPGNLKSDFGICKLPSEDMGLAIRGYVESARLVFCGGHWRRLFEVVLKECRCCSRGKRLGCRSWLF